MVRQLLSFGHSGKTRLRFLIALVVVLVLIFFGWQHFQQKPDAMAKAPGMRGPMGMGMTNAVYVGNARTANVDVYLHALGTVQANNTVTVTSRVTGELMQLFFKEGQYVEKGQRLAQIDDRSYQATLAQYQGQLAQNEAQLKNAEQTLTRYQGLFKQDSLSKQDLQDQVAAVGQYRGAVMADKAQIRAAKLNIEYANIRAPLSGYVGLRLVDPGNLVSSDSTEIVTITQTQPITAVFNIPQAKIGTVRGGLRQGEKFAVLAFDQNGQQQLAAGELKYMSNQIDTDTGTVQLKAQFANKDSTLFPNQFVNIKLKLQTLKDAVEIPQSALQLNSEGDFVYVLNDDHTVSKRIVTQGPADGEDWIVIKAGVSAGDQVVTTGVDNLSDGAKVKVLTQQQGRS